MYRPSLTYLYIIIDILFLNEHFSFAIHETKIKLKIKDPWTKTTGEGRIERGRWGWVGQGRVMGGNGGNSNCTITKI